MTDKAKYHLSGIAGSGMNPLAQALLAEGHPVTGSDRYFDRGEDLPIIRKLQALGVKFFAQDGSGISGDCSGLVISTAIESDNPEILTARQHGIPQLHRSEMLAQLVENKTTIAIAGTSGKTTTTGMVGYALEQLNLDPNVINGGVIVNWADDQCIGNVRSGKSDTWVIEADESDRSLLNYTPEWAIINTISIDHFDLEETIELFRLFAAKVKKGIVCGPGVSRHLQGATEASLIELSGNPTDFQLHMPGRHNQVNAIATATLCEAITGDRSLVQEALSSFQGIERRLQNLGGGAVTVYDDFGHNPEKIRAAIEATRPDNHRLFLGWKPHGYGPLKNMADELVRMLSTYSPDSISVHILPVYYVGGTTNPTMHSEDFVELLSAAGVNAHFAPNYEELRAVWTTEAKAGDICLSMGARDPELPRFARRVARQMEDSK